MWKISWQQIDPILEYNGTCYVRYLLRRRDRLNLKKGLKITAYLEWVARMIVPPDKKMMYHSKTVEEILYILEGKGIFKSNDFEQEIEPCDTIHIPAMTPRTLWSSVEHQPLIFNSYVVSVPPDSKTNPEIKKEMKATDEKITIRNWLELPSRSGHADTCWLTRIFSRGDPLKYIGFSSIMTASSIVSYHRHNVEATYYILQGEGIVRVGGEEEKCTAGDIIYIPTETAHQAWTVLSDQPLNVFCCGIPVPWNVEPWTIERLPHID